MRLSEFFENAGTRDIVINTDIDGFLSGMILQEYYDCRVVGFSNSRESIWLKPEIDSIYKPVYVDIFVNNPDTFCIDQHVIAYDEAHLNNILTLGTKLNPNINVWRKTYLDDYYHKYPFGTVHYLIALAEQDGHTVRFNELTVEQRIIGADGRYYDIAPGQVILRADDALFSSLGPYASNAQDWWRRLRVLGAGTTNMLYEYVYNMCDSTKNAEYKSYIGDFFRWGLRCDGADGAFNSVTDSSSRLQSRIEIYNRIITNIVGVDLTLPKELREYRGIAERNQFTSERLRKATTYAFVCSPRKPNDSFSYTINFR